MRNGRYTASSRYSRKRTLPMSGKTTVIATITPAKTAAKKNKIL